MCKITHLSNRRGKTRLHLWDGMRAPFLVPGLGGVNPLRRRDPLDILLSF